MQNVVYNHIKCFILTAGNIVPLLNFILRKLGFQELNDNGEALHVLYQFLLERCADFRVAASTAIKEGVIAGMKFLETVIVNIIEVCKEHKETTYHLLKLNAKIGLRGDVVKLSTKLIVAYGLAPIISLCIMGVDITPFSASAITDLMQFGLEVTGYKGLGATVGKWGNIGIGAIAGGMTGGFLSGAPLGALVGFGIWVIGEAFGKIIEKTL